MKPPARVCEVAQQYGVRAPQITTWRRLARKSELALLADEAPDFVTIEVSAPIAAREATPTEISLGRVSVRLDADASAARIQARTLALLLRGGANQV